MEVLVQIKFVSVFVEDQERALQFYTGMLGFKKVADVPLGEARWLTVTSPDGPEGVELLLEPTAFPPAREYQKALFDAGIPATTFVTTDIQGDFERLKAAGVAFRGEPAAMGDVRAVAFEDTCGNLIQLVQTAV
jgi:catechol 2,3-dioxygenase-like lactoylglutathione lyase family enzyme